MNKKLAVLSTGAIGSSIGADLTEAGHDVLLIDQWPAHVEAMESHGLSVTMPGKAFQIPVQAVHICDLCSLEPQLDIVFLAAKSYDTRWMVELIKPYLKSDGVIVSAQNSMNDEWIAPMIGPERDIGCALELSAEVFEPGILKRNTNRDTSRFVIGELNGEITTRVQELAQILSAVGRTEVSTNIWGAKWTKLVVNTMGMGLGAIAGLITWHLAQNQKYLDYSIKLGRETAQVAVALGYVLEPVFGLTAKDFLSPKDEELKNLLLSVVSDIGKEQRTCVLQDLLKGRLTEVSYLNGLVVQKGQEVNISTPYNAAVNYLIRQIEQRKMKMSIDNLEKLEQYLQ